MSAQEIEQAIAKLPADEYFQLRDQIQRRFDKEWDAQCLDLPKVLAAPIENTLFFAAKPLPWTRKRHSHRCNRIELARDWGD